MNIDLAELVLRTVARDHLEGRRSDLDTLTEDLGIRRADVRSTLSALHQQGYIDVLRMRLTMEGFALGVSLSEQEFVERPSIAA
jgi:DNA-binding IclR family transcriptional regulator